MTPKTDRDQKLIKILTHFPGIQGEIIEVQPLGNGIINDTYQIRAEKSYVLQRLNTEVFKKPYQVMENISRVTDAVSKAGGETLSFLKTDTGALSYTDSDGETWRLSDYIEDSLSYDNPESLDHFEEGGALIGDFHRMLAAFPGDSLYETIPGFHDTPRYYDLFLAAVKEDKAKRAAVVSDEISFLKDQKNLARYFLDHPQPVRVTHGDTKFGNLLFRKDQGIIKGLALIDLDTLMPGILAYDFGDAIRSGANSLAEDDPDISGVHFAEDRYEAFKRGFLRGMGDGISQTEIEALPYGAMVITYEQALRFLTDYLNGDSYYKVKYRDHNLVRSRNQIALLREMIEKLA